MCGIISIWSANDTLPKEELQSYLPLIKHRGPDDSDAVLLTPHLGFGHVRLSIIDLSPGGHQPKKDEQSGVVVTYNGEIYNYQELKSELQSHGHRFESTSDTEVLLKAYLQWGPKCLERFYGMFAFVLWDPRDQTLFAARDRLGIKPLYWFFDGQQLILGSELKIFQSYLKRQGRLSLNETALAHYLTLRAVATPETLLQGVHRLGPGEYFILKNHPQAPKPLPFWKLSDYAQEKQMSKAQALEELKTRFKTSIKRRLVADVPVGCFLSGGIDSSLVTLYAAKLSSGKTIHTFSVDFDEERFSERRYFDFVAQKAKTQHHVFTMKPSGFLDFLPQWAEMMDDLVSDPSSLPFHFVALEARKNNVKVVLSGEGADELFGGYNSYAQFLKWSKFQPIAKAFPDLAQWFNLNEDRQDLWRRLGQKFPFYGTAYVFGAQERKKILRHDISLDSWQQNIFNDARRLSSINQMLYFDLATRIPTDLLMRTDRSTMAASIECRVPFLDHELVEFALGVPGTLKINNGEQKFILKEMARQHFPEWFINRPKIGFNVPLDLWFSHELKPLLEQIFIQEKLIGAFNYDNIKILLQSHWSGHFQGAKIWNLLALELWYRQWIATVRQ